MTLERGNGMAKVTKVQKDNGEWVEVDYATLCHELGFDPDAGFVEVRRGMIGWSIGKDHEIIALKRACRDHGYKASKALREWTT